jgi:hypothetical protein
VIGTKVGRIKAHGASQRKQSERTGNMRGSFQRTNRESLMSDIFFTVVLNDTHPLKHLSILIMVTRIEQLFAVHNSPANRRVTKDETNVVNNKFLTDTYSTGYPIKRYNDIFFPTSDSD